jgi:hypothetical protein
VETWFGSTCPNCKKYILFCVGDVFDLTSPDVEYIKCWNCYIILKMPEFFDEALKVAKNKKVVLAEQSYPRPELPREALSE